MDRFLNLRDTVTPYPTGRPFLGVLSQALRARLRSLRDEEPKNHSEQPLLVISRAWLESNIEVVTKDSNAVVLERLPLALDSPDPPSLCYQLMDEFRDNRVYSTDVLNLEFRYKQAA